MEELMCTIRSVFKFFKQPHRIGDTLDVEGVLYLVIGIERFKVYSTKLVVWYTVQDLSRSDYISRKSVSGQNTGEIELVIKMKHDDERWKNVHLGKTSTVEGSRYRLTEYTSICLKSTDIEVCVIGKIIHPVNRKEARAKFTQERMKRLNLEVY